MVVEIGPVLSDLHRIHPRFFKKAREWATSIQENGLLNTQRNRGDHPLQSYRGDRREGMWATRLNHRYRLIYRIESDRIIAVRIDNHNKHYY